MVSVSLIILPRSSQLLRLLPGSHGWAAPEPSYWSSLGFLNGFSPLKMVTLGDHFQFPSCGSQPCAADPAPSWMPGSGTLPFCSSPPPAGLTAPNLECWKVGSQPATRSASSHVGPVGPYNLGPSRLLFLPPHSKPTRGSCRFQLQKSSQDPSPFATWLPPPYLVYWLHCRPPHSPPHQLIFTVPPYSGQWDMLLQSGAHPQQHQTSQAASISPGDEPMS